MDAKHIIYLGMLLVLVPGVIAAMMVSNKVRDWALFLMVFCTAIAYSAQVTFLDRIWYRGTSIGYEISLVDVLAIGLAVVAIIRPRPGQGRIFWPAGLAPLLIYVGYCCCSVLLSNPQMFGLWEIFKELRGVVIILAVAWTVRSDREVKILVMGLASAVLYLGFTALNMHRQGGYRVDAHLVHPNSLSMYLCMSGPILCAATMSNLTKRAKWFCVIGIILSLFGVILTVSRTGIVVWGVVMLGVSLACMSYRLTAKGILIGMIALCFVCGAVAFSWKTLGERMKSTDIEDENDPNKLGRGSYLKLADLIVQEHFFGVGLNNWSWYVTNEYEAKYSSLPALQYKPYIGTGADDRPDKIPLYGAETAQAAPAHNLGALTRGELGYPGLVLFLLVWLRWFDMGQRFLWKRSPVMMRRVAVGVLFGMSAIFLQSLTEWAYRQTAIFTLFHIWVGALAAMYHVRKKRTAAPVAAPQMMMAVEQPQPRIAAGI